LAACSDEQVVGEVLADARDPVIAKAVVRCR
jgi:hypothetical protein